VLLSTHIVEDIENLCERVAILAKGRILAEGSPSALVAPLAGQLWSRVVPRGQPVPAALNLLAAPGGTRIIIRSAARPGDAFDPWHPRLEDAYYLALSATEIEEAA
jgi:ABC-type multidrug transport system ATPase subunit